MCIYAYWNVEPLESANMNSSRGYYNKFYRVRSSSTKSKLNFMIMSLLLVISSINLGYTQDYKKIIQGYVMNAEDESFVPNATLVFGKDTFKSGADGLFSILSNDTASMVTVFALNYDTTQFRLPWDTLYNIKLPIQPIAGMQTTPSMTPALGTIITNSDTSQWEAKDTMAVTISGQVVDPKGEAVIGAFVKFDSAAAGVVTDIEGNFTITKHFSDDWLTISSMGFSPFDTMFDNHIEISNLKIVLEEMKNEIQGAVIVGKRTRKKYRNKNNPAVEFMRNVIARKEENHFGDAKTISYDSYEKMTLSTSNLPKFLKSNFIVKKFKFIFDNEDTMVVPGRKMLMFYLQEKEFENYAKVGEKKPNQILVSEKKIRFDERFIQNQYLEDGVNYMFNNVDIYEDNIWLFTNFFMSPIANAAPTFYRYYLRDTAVVDGERIVRVEFMPRNRKDFVFTGNVYVNMDKNYAIQKIDLGVDPQINLNTVRSFGATIDYANVENKHLPKQTDIWIDFGIGQNSKRGVYSQRTFVNSNFKINPVVNSEKWKEDTKDKILVDSSIIKPNHYWDTLRPIALNKFELNTYKNVDSLNKMPAFRRLLKLQYLIGSGFYQQGFLEFGEHSSLFSYNPVEGLRTRVAVRTSLQDTKRYMLQGALGYGFKDEKFKYFGRFTYSIPNKNIFTFPMHYFRVAYMSDIRIPGQSMEFDTPENILTIFKRGDNNTWVYNKLFNFSYLKEFENHFTLLGGFQVLNQTPAGKLVELEADPEYYNKTIDATEFSAGFRWAPKEVFFQGRTQRTQMNNPFPILEFTYKLGVKDLFGGDYDYQKFSMKLTKRFYIPQAGYIASEVQGDYLTGKVPYTLLNIPSTNQSYIYSKRSFNLMNPLEFVTDHSINFNAEYHMMGFLFNRIPGIERLRLREVFTIKGIYGGLRAENDIHKLYPNSDRSINNDLGGKPYLEASVGVENILRFLRVDFVKRLTHTDYPGAPDWGVRVQFATDL